MIRLGGLTALGVLVADQATKWWILEVVRLPEVRDIAVLPFLNLTMVWNRGVTFGLLSGDGAWNQIILSVVAAVVVVMLARWMARADSRFVAVALGIIAGGAIGNVIDRLRFGAVVDFVHVHVAGWSWYVFNIADAAIVCGVIALIADALLRPRLAPTEGT